MVLLNLLTSMVPPNCAFSSQPRLFTWKGGTQDQTNDTLFVAAKISDVCFVRKIDSVSVHPTNSAHKLWVFFKIAINE